MYVTEFLCSAIGQNGVIVIFYKIHIDNMIKIIILLYWCVLKSRYELKPFSVVKASYIVVHLKLLLSQENNLISPDITCNIILNRSMGLHLRNTCTNTS